MNKVVIGSSVNRLEGYAFHGCESIKTMEVLASNPPKGESSNIFENSIYENVTLTVPKGTIDVYKKNWPWNRFKNFAESDKTPVEREGETLIGMMVGGICCNTDGPTKTAEITRGPYTEGYFPVYEGDFVIPSSVVINGVTYTVTKIGDFAFGNGDYTSLTSVTIPNTIKEIGKGAFFKKKGLKLITIPSSVEVMGDNPFEQCTGLESINVAVGNKHFMADGNLFMTSDGTRLISVFGTNVHAANGIDINVPNTVKSMDVSVATYEDGIRSVTIPNSVTTIGKDAFFHCTSLQSVKISRSVNSIGEGVFGSCTSLTEIEIEKGNANYEFVDGMLLTTDGKCLLHSLTNKLTVTIPETVENICDFAISVNPNITEIVIPDKVSRLGYMAMQTNSNLEKVVLGKSLKEIETCVLRNCPKLLTIYSMTTSPVDFDDAFLFEPYFEVEGVGYGNKNYDEATLYVPSGCADAYKVANGWKNFKNIAEFNLTGVSAVTSDADSTPVSVYRLDGRKVHTVGRGVNITCHSDGSTRKVVVK